MPNYDFQNGPFSSTLCPVPILSNSSILQEVRVNWLEELIFPANALYSFLIPNLNIIHSDLLI